MIKRVVTGTLAVLTLLALASLDNRIAEQSSEIWFLPTLLRQGSLIPLAIVGVIILGMVEMIHMLRAVGLNPHAPVAYIGSMTLVLSPWLIAGEIIGDGVTDVTASLDWQIIWLTAITLLAAIAHIRRGPSPTAIADVSATMFLVVYLGLLPSFAVHLRCDYALGDAAYGVWALVIVLLVTSFADIGALYVGKAIGRTKLSPAISPGKTVEGFVGGLFASATIAVALHYVGISAQPDAPSLDTAGVRFGLFVVDATNILIQMKPYQAALFGLILAFVGQIGDLFESLCKRTANMKDSSTLVPGMGGVLDVIDSAIFATPVAWFLLTHVWSVL